MNESTNLLEPGLTSEDIARRAELLAEVQPTQPVENQQPENAGQSPL